MVVDNVVLKSDSHAVKPIFFPGGDIGRLAISGTVNDIAVLSAESARELAIRLGFGEYFPWKSEEELADYRLKPLGITFKEAATERYIIGSSEPWTYETINPKTGEPTGFATPSGKIELYSNVLEKLGYDPLPFCEEGIEGTGV